MFSKDARPLAAPFVAALNGRDVAARQLDADHIVTFGKLKDGSVLITSTYEDSVEQGLEVTSLKIPSDSKTPAELCSTSWNSQGSLGTQETIIEPKALLCLLPLLPLPE